MTDENRASDEALVEAITSRARRKQRARRRRRDSVWSGLGMFGLIGWSIAAPMLLGLAIGMAIDAWAPGRRAWTLSLLLVGLALGCVNAWRWIEREHRAIEREHPTRTDPEEES